MLWMSSAPAASAVLAFCVFLCTSLCGAEAKGGASAKATETVLYAFAGGSDGAYPAGILASDSGGNLYGTTSAGGAYGAGTIFELSPGSGGVWTEGVIYTFTGGVDGGYPNGGLTIDNVGNLYGTTVRAGASGLGTVFELSPASGGGWLFSTIHAFSGPDGATSYTPVTFAAAGNLYGTTREGGKHGYGVVFEMKRNAAGVWSESVLYSFTGGKDEGFPMSGVVLDASGNIYGTNVGVVEDAPGVAFQLSRQPSGGWKIKPFVNVGLYPDSTPIIDDAGNVYGTTYEGGYGYGNIYELQPESGGRWKQEQLWSFSGGTDGSYPYSSLVRNSQGNLYGVTPSGGATGNGVVYELMYESPYWNELELYSFKGGTDGSLPETLLAGPVGTFYGTTQFGGENGFGTVFAITLQ